MSNPTTPQGFWDAQFAAPGYKYGTAPNAFLVSQAALLPSRARVLVPGDGEGRNGVWLAQQGHQVTAIDSSAVGLAKARALAAAHGVEIETIEADLSTWTAGAARYDAVVLVYVHLPPSIRATVHRTLWASLGDGGLLILEAFHPRQQAYGSGGPKDAAMLYTLERVRADFAGDARAMLEEVNAWEGEVVLDEGPGHQGPAVVTRLVARRHGG